MGNGQLNMYVCTYVFYCPISKIRLMGRDRTKRGYSCHVSYLRALCSQLFKVIKSMAFVPRSQIITYMYMHWPNPLRPHS